MDIDQAKKIIDAAKAEVDKEGPITDDMRKKAATTQDKKTQYIAARQREAGNAQFKIIKGAAKNFNDASNVFSSAVITFGKKMDGLEKKVKRDRLNPNDEFAQVLDDYGIKIIAKDILTELKNLASALISPTATNKVKALTK